MTLEEIYRTAIEAKEKHSVIGVCLHFTKGFKRPKGFPRGELLNETEVGNLYAFNPDKIIAWVKKQPQFNQTVTI